MTGHAPPTLILAASPHLGQTKSKGGLLSVPFHLVHDDANEASAVAVHGHGHVVKALAFPDEFAGGVAMDVPLSVQDFAGMRRWMSRADGRRSIGCGGARAGTIYTVAVDPSGARGGKSILGLLLTLFFGRFGVLRG